MGGRLIPVFLSCTELADIYMALSIIIDVFDKRDLVETRKKIAEVFYERCREMVE